MQWLGRKNRIWVVGLLAIFASGCSTWDLPWNPLDRRAQSPDEEVAIGGKTKIVGDLSVPYGLFPLQVEGVGLISGLQGTGSDPAPSGQRSVLLEDMKARSVRRPSKVLASNSTALVLVRGVLRPGIQKGDRFDLEVRVPSRSDTTNLRGGWLLETRMSELAVMGDQQLRKGNLWGFAEGPVLIDPTVDVEKNPVHATRGVILGTGHCSKTRALGLVLKEKHQNVRNAAMIEKAINLRFHRMEGGIQEGVAKAINDKYIELTVHPRYKENVERYMQVVRAIAIRESTVRRAERIALLEEQLADPTMARNAAKQLEAIGREACDPLKRALASEHLDVRFFAAESLAYLDKTEAAEPLGQVARTEPAFRVFALTALSAMNDYAAYEQLVQLLDVESAETRYGAFRAIWLMNPRDPKIHAEIIHKQFALHSLPSKGSPMVHVTRNTRPEVVLFGDNQRFVTPLLMEAGPRIRVSSEGNDRVAVSRFAPNEPDQKRIVSSRVDEVIRAVGELGGTYPDVVQMLSEAKEKNILLGRFEVDLLPKAGRKYHRQLADKSETDESGMDELDVEEEPESKSWWDRLSKPEWSGSDSDDLDQTDSKETGEATIASKEKEPSA